MIVEKNELSDEDNERQAMWYGKNDEGLSGEWRRPIK